MTLEEQLRRIVREEVREALSENLPEPSPEPVEPTSWGERLWTVPAETRLGVQELSEALDRPKSFVYKATSSDEIPHRKMSGSLVFVAGEIRGWIRETEEVEVAGSEARERLLELTD